MQRAIIFFDGVCGLCHGLIRWLDRIDRKQRFHFASLQGETAKRLLPEYLHQPTTVVLWRPPGNKIESKSEAVLSILSLLGWPKLLVSLLRLCPRIWRDRLYDVIARYRYRVFGRRALCRLPAWSRDPHRFLP